MNSWKTTRIFIVRSSSVVVHGLLTVKLFGLPFFSNLFFYLFLLSINNQFLQVSGACVIQSCCSLGSIISFLVRLFIVKVGHCIRSINQLRASFQSLCHVQFGQMVQNSVVSVILANCPNLGNKQITYKLMNCHGFTQFCGSVSFWYGSVSGSDLKYKNYQLENPITIFSMYHCSRWKNNQIM